MTTTEYFATHRDRILRELIDFAGIPSVSTDPAHRADIDTAANWVADRIRAAGPFDVRIMPTRRHPVVFAQWLGAPGKPTVLLYGHYDVQPAEPLEKWITPPFQPTVRTMPDGEARLYARGISDDKAPVYQAIVAAEAFFATQGALPLNLKFIFEGEEEIGSPSLEPFIREHAALLDADFIISADGGMLRTDLPSLIVATRGITAVEFKLTGPAKDLHSGVFGGAVQNPLHALAELVAGLHTADGRVAVEGFYDDVVELTPQERAAVAAVPFDDAAFQAELGAPALFGETGYTPLEQMWTRPTLDINGLGGGYQGAGTKTVIPSEAFAKITSRLVPNQEPEDIAAKVIRHLVRHLPTGVRLTTTGEAHGARPYRIRPDHFGLNAAAAALEEMFGVKPVFTRMGGSVPVCEVFQRVLGRDTVFFSFSTGDEDFHAPNEFFRVSRLYQGLEGWARYWTRLGQ